jgi:CheY-like chemotaxis protein
MRRIRALPADMGGGLPAIAVTGLASREDARQTLAAGFSEHLAKPLQLDKLLESLSRLAGDRITHPHRTEPEGNTPS